MRVLVVEDHPTIQAIVQDQLESLGADVVLADSEAAAWQAVRKQRFDAALVDVVLPGTDGMALCRRLRETYRCRQVLMMSGYPEWWLKSRQIGARPNLVKPFNVPQLAEALGLGDVAHHANPATWARSTVAMPSIGHQARQASAPAV